MDYLEFIARVISHIPDKGQVMVCYYGLSSNAQRECKMCIIAFIEDHNAIGRIIRQCR